MIVSTARLDLHPLPLIDALLRRDLAAARAGAPDGEGTVEIGYRVQPAWRRQGLATELAAGLLDWAAEQGVARCLASTAPGNAASQAVLARLGFVRTGEAMDEVDGLELVFTLELQRAAAVG